MASLGDFVQQYIEMLNYNIKYDLYWKFVIKYYWILCLTCVLFWISLMAGFS